MVWEESRVLAAKVPRARVLSLSWAGLRCMGQVSGPLRARCVARATRVGRAGDLVFFFHKELAMVF